MIKEYLDKRNLHHAYLIEGDKEDVIPQIISFFEELGLDTVNNPDFLKIYLDTFKIEDAERLKLLSNEKSFSDKKKIYLISVNNILLEAQNTLLKIFEDPIKDTHFFLIVPNTNFLINTLTSRFFNIKLKTEIKKELVLAEEFLKMNLKSRIDFIKDFLKEEESENNTESAKARTLKFINALEKILSENKEKFNLLDSLQQIFNVRSYLNQNGTSTKTLLEGLALNIPILN